jgi:MoaA/NifB/PqqE/SkfB family radical SAM enzyme
MRLDYAFKTIPELGNLSVTVENRGDKIRTAVKGKCSLLQYLIIKQYFSFYSWLKPLIQEDIGNIYSLYLPAIPSLAHARMFESTFSTIHFKRPLPLAVTIGVTTACQYNCVHCSAAGRSRSKPVMSLKELLSVVQGCLDLGVANITFTGGEPLLRPDLEECIAAVPHDLAVPQVFTNGLALTASRAQSLKAAGLWGVQISLDSPDPKKHDRLRGHNGAFRAVEAGIRNALDAGLMVGLSTYATKKHALEHDIIPIMALCADWGVHEVSVFDAISTGRLRGQTDEMLDAPSRKVLLSDCKALNRKYKGRLRVVSQSWTNYGKGFMARNIGCLAAHMQFHITAQGDFTPCDFTPLSFGNIRDKSLQNLWFSLLRHPAYCKHSRRCRMQAPLFREKYINTIPESADLPYPIADQ